MTMTKAKQVANALRGYVPVKGKEIVWYLWDCPFCGREDHVTVPPFPVKEHCTSCGRQFILYDPTREPF